MGLCKLVSEFISFSLVCYFNAGMLSKQYVFGTLLGVGCLRLLMSDFFALKTFHGEAEKKSLDRLETVKYLFHGGFLRAFLVRSAR